MEGDSESSSTAYVTGTGTTGGTVSSTGPTSSTTIETTSSSSSTGGATSVSSSETSTSGTTIAATTDTSATSSESDVSGPSQEESESTGIQNPVDCFYDVSVEMSPEIGTVAIVTWSVDLAAIDHAYIDFGPDGSYGMRAPVDLDAPGHRTLLLGMAPSSEYHFRITVEGEGGGCRSDDFEIMTDPSPNGLTLPTVTVARPSEVMPGFIITSESAGRGGGSMILVYDHTGTLVWWYQASFGQISRAKLSYDGRWMIARNTNPSGDTGGNSFRVSLDGLVEEAISVPSGHHDFTVTPDNAIVMPVGSADDCDEIVKIEENGDSSVLFTVADAFPDLGSGGIMVNGDLCHTNSIHYNEEDESFSFSVLHQNAYVKISAAGELQWVLGGEASEFTGDGAEWNRQHGHHLLSPTRLLFFNNNGRSGGSATESLALEVELDLTAMTATRVWSYAGDNSSITLGDVQRLDNGNTLTTYSNAGVIHEVNAALELVQSFEWSLGGAVGYVHHRPSLYGPPPH